MQLPEREPRLAPPRLIESVEARKLRWAGWFLVRSVLFCLAVAALCLAASSPALATSTTSVAEATTCSWWKPWCWFRGDNPSVPVDGENAGGVAPSSGGVDGSDPLSGAAISVVGGGRSVEGWRREALELGRRLVGVIDRRELPAIHRLSRDVDAAVVGLDIAHPELQERLLWEVAAAYTNFANEMDRPRADFEPLASRARARWWSYIHWYHSLSSGARGALPISQRRVARATFFLGDAGRRMRRFHDIFSYYAEVPSPIYFGARSLALWKSWLYRCPAWPPVVDRSDPQVRARAICADSCTDAWLSYAETLRAWAREVVTEDARRRTFFREADQIEVLSDACSDA